MKDERTKSESASAVDSKPAPGMTGTLGEKLAVLSCGSFGRANERYFESLPGLTIISAWKKLEIARI
ncbi:hypothetical protein BDC45DRAFT_565031 [Circinella umbellata]|nr:hypothetical protein BDC45DRAFT_565031 [Circinella umbellata]